MITELCIDVINAFTNLNRTIAASCEHIQTLDRSLPAWLQPPAKLNLAPNAYRDNACALIRQVEYLNNQEPREILVGAGIMAASAETISMLDELNTAKESFKKAMLTMKSAKVSPSHEYLSKNFEELLPQREPGVAQNMSRMGLSRLHLKQCYRRIPLLKHRPKKISWTWANTRSIKKITVEQAEQMLLKHTLDSGIEMQLKLLQGISPSEPLAIVQELAPHLRANIVMPDGNRVMVKGPVPIFYLQDEDLPLPEYVPPK